jgi:hypothetical protein
MPPILTQPRSGPLQNRRYSKQRKDGQTALLVYAGDAFTVTPLTDDTETIASQLEALNTDIMPSQGSDTTRHWKKPWSCSSRRGCKGQILLVTDGVDVDKTWPQSNRWINQLSILRSVRTMVHR